MNQSSQEILKKLFVMSFENCLKFLKGPVIDIFATKFLSEHQSKSARKSFVGGWHYCIFLYITFLSKKKCSIKIHIMWIYHKIVSYILLNGNREQPFSKYFCNLKRKQANVNTKNPNTTIDDDDVVKHYSQSSLVRQ